MGILGSVLACRHRFEVCKRPVQRLHNSIQRSPLSKGISLFRSARAFERGKARMSKYTLAAYLLWLLLGWTGLHHFYLGRDRQGLLWLTSFAGVFGIGESQRGRISEAIRVYC